MFCVGQQVGFLREKGTALILQIDKKKAIIEDCDGFEREVLLSELIELHSTSFPDKELLELSPSQLSQQKGVIQSREERSKAKSQQHLGIKEWEIDLHIEELVDSLTGLHSTDMLLRQMSSFKATFRKAKEQRINRLIVIHGVGEGVLKNEVRSFLSKQEQIEFFDADFAKYGKGATAIVFHPNW